MTDDEREKIKSRLRNIDRARTAIREMRRPHDEALDALQAMEDEIYADVGVDILGTCTGCERLMIAGDIGHTGEDCMFCEACAPTWNDLAKQYLEGRPEDSDDPEGFEFSRKIVADAIEKGHGGEKNVRIL